MVGPSGTLTGMATTTDRAKEDRRILLAYAEHGRYDETAAALDITVPQVRRAIMRMIERTHANSSIQAFYRLTAPKG